jgi:hypothetical protein
MNVIGHHHAAKQVCAKFIFTNAAREDDISGSRRELPSLMRAEGDEQQLAPTL